MLSDNSLNSHYTGVKSPAVIQLRALGYAPEDAIALTAFLPKGHPKTDRKVVKNPDKGRKGEGTLQQLQPQIDQWVKEGRGVYLAVNGAHQNADVKSCRAVFYEHDDLPIEIQVGLWETIGLPAPSLQISSGGKSVHSYWTFDQPIPPDVWKKLQIDLMELADSDRSLKNPNRVMRLAGCPHFSFTEDQLIQGRVASILSTGPRYDYATIRKAIPSTETAPTIKPTATPLTQGDEDEQVREALSYIPPRRPGTGSYDDSLNILMALQSHYGAAKGLQMARLWSPDEDWGEDLDRKMAGFKGEGITIATLFGIAKQYGYRPRKQSPPVAPSPERIKETVEAIAHNGSSVTLAVRQLYGRGLAGSALSGALTELAKSLQVATGEVRRLYEQIDDEHQRESERPEIKAELDSLLQAQKSDLDLRQIFPADLAYAFGLVAHRFDCSGGAAALTAFSGISTLIHRQTRARVDSEWMEPAGVWTALVGQSGETKSPIINAVCGKPIAAIANELDEHWETRHKAWKAETGGKPDDIDANPEPSLETIYHSKATIEGVYTCQRVNKPHGDLMLLGELRSWIDGARKDDNRGDWLTLWEAHPLRKTKQGNGTHKDANLSVKYPHVVICGAIQPDILGAFLRSPEASDGLFSRFLFAHLPPRWVKRGGKNLEEYSPTINRYYKGVQQLGQSPKIIPLSMDAEKVFTHWTDEILGEMSKLGTDAKELLNKARGYAVRVALTLQHIWDVAGGAQSPVITLATMERAIAVVMWHLQQCRVIKGEATGEGASMLTHQMRAIIAASNGDWVKARDLNSKKLRGVKSDAIRELFVELAQMGFGVVEGEGTRIKFRSVESAANCCKSAALFTAVPTPCPIRDTTTTTTTAVTAAHFFSEPEDSPILTQQHGENSNTRSSCSSAALLDQPHTGQAVEGAANNAALSTAVSENAALWRPTHIYHRGPGEDIPVKAWEKNNSRKVGLWIAIDDRGYEMTVEARDLTPYAPTPTA